MPEAQELPKGLVSKPQYDVRLFPPGIALYVDATKDRYHKATGDLQNFKGYVLVREAEPLLLTVGYVKVTKKRSFDDEPDETSIRDLDIPIDLVAEGIVSIEIIIRKENGGLNL
jgi:hypothetical protein